VDVLHVLQAGELVVYDPGHHAVEPVELAYRTGICASWHRDYGSLYVEVLYYVVGLLLEQLLKILLNDLHFQRQRLLVAPLLAELIENDDVGE
jgi:hypothetical protein